MSMITRIVPAAALAFLLAGCSSTTITNLTPGQTYRNSSGLYPVEAALTTHQQTLQWNTINASVIVGSQSMKMEATKLMTNRWEALIQIPPGRNSAAFKFKFDYKYNGMGGEGADSLSSPVYHLQILDNPSR